MAKKEYLIKQQSNNDIKLYNQEIDSLELYGDFNGDDPQCIIIYRKNISRLIEVLNKARILPPVTKKDIAERKQVLAWAEKHK